MKVLLILSMLTTLTLSFGKNQGKTIGFVGKITAMDGNTVTLTGENGVKGLFKRADIVNEISQKDLSIKGEEAEKTLNVKLGAEVHINGKKLIVGTDLPDPNSKKAKDACKCKVTCGVGTCCAVAGYKTKCKDGICQYTMDLCKE
jgi:hypothetical protein